MHPDPPETTPPALPAAPAPPASAEPGVPAHLEGLAETARDYARGAKAANTQRAYAADWRHYEAWCRRKDLAPLPPDPQVVGLYVAACASEPPAASRFRCGPSSAGFRRSPGCAPSKASRLTAPTVTSWR